ncbi:MAG: nitroreductase family protein [Clostridiaceae bacterium]|nr:nitroreductase family protein [Clostridiaceae bacterium]
MDVISAIKKRSSCRDFKKTQIKNEDLNLLMDAALASPTAINLQDLKINVVQDANLIHDISQECFRLMDEKVKKRMQDRKADSIFYNAPTVFILSSPKTIYSDLNAGIVAQSLCIAAESLGLASCIIGMAAPAFAKTNPNNLKNRLDMADDECFCVSVAIGYANSKKLPHEFNYNQIRGFF